MHRIISRDDKGNPTKVHTDDGYMETCRNYDPETDGWIDDQLHPDDFSIIQMGRQMEALVNEINALRRENFRLRKNEEKYLKSYFGRQ